MAGLQRSATTFRRSGSSGLVWDERFLTEAEAGAEAKAGDGAAEPQPELRHSRSVGSIGLMRRGGGRGGDDDEDNKKAKQKKQKQAQKEEARSQQVFRTKDVAPDVDPPSPRVSGCILCAIFGSSSSGPARRRSKPRKK
ncbi:hypothetical protein ACP70R_043308 [Stipagrostis hirtigluma subsp. patula]